MTSSSVQIPPVGLFARHAIDRNIELARQLGADARPEDYRLPPTAQAQAWLRGVLAAHGMEHRQYLVAVPGTRWPTKVYPARLWQRALGLVTPRRPIVLVGAGDEIGLCDEIANGVTAQAGGGGGAPLLINLAGKTNLPQLVALIASAGGVVCGDSAAAYIAPAVQTPFVMLIGPTREDRTGPYGSLGRALVAPVACQGCLKRRCLHTTCMQTIVPGDVAMAVSGLIDLGKR